MEELHKILN